MTSTRNAQSASLIPIFVAVLIVIASAQSRVGPSERQQFPPRDESASAPGFTPFLARFRKALAEKSVDSLLSMINADIRPSPFGDDRLIGRVAFRKYHRLDDPKSEFWMNMRSLLDGAGAVDGCNGPTQECQVSYPFWLTRVPPEFDKLDHVVVLQNASMYERPAPAASVVERLNYELVRRVTEHQRLKPEGWEEIELFDGRKGFVRSSDVYRFTSWRMTFVRQANGTWILWDFLAGD